MSDSPKRIAILGSTGSIGTQALEVIREHPEHFSAEILAAGNNADLLIKQALEFQPNIVVIAGDAAYKKVKAALSSHPIKVYSGEKSIEEVVAFDSVDMVLAAIVGYAGLSSTLAAIKAGKSVALANKETLVVAGGIITAEAKVSGAGIIPVDSEHSAIFQCLAGEWKNPLEKIILTASGGPFRGKKKSDLEKVTVADALKHPNWNMGSKITIDSASLMNKGLEVIEAKWLFGLRPEQIEVLVHPQSIIHSMVQFHDGSMKAQMGLPDMKLPILYAFSFPLRLPSATPRLNLNQFPSLSFENPDSLTFPCLDLAYEAMRKGGNAPCVLNAANEMAVQAFLSERIGFNRIPEIISETLYAVSYVPEPSYEDLILSDKEARKQASAHI
ncbi:MAG: 1-deoxy-D-xylulose-5-phosphate reductoisomerase [Bacteroidia bacterium]|nr:1-deoxy-D-xylulose-5-phosphate reductoisomerase [Bacteroidia bacterium]